MRDKNEIETQKELIINNLETFFDDVLIEELNKAKIEVSEIYGKGTTKAQNEVIKEFFDKFKKLTTNHLEKFLKNKIEKSIEYTSLKYANIIPQLKRDIEEELNVKKSSLEISIKNNEKSRKEKIEYYRKCFSIFIDNANNYNRLNIIRYELLEKDFKILKDEMGYSYEKIFRPYIDDAVSVYIEEPYLIKKYQINNFFQFAILCLKSNVKNINLVTNIVISNENQPIDSSEDDFEKLQEFLNEKGLNFKWERREIHDRKIIVDNQWIFSIGRGLDIYQKPDNEIDILNKDFNFRKCKETYVKIYRK